MICMSITGDIGDIPSDSTVRCATHNSTLRNPEKATCETTDHGAYDQEPLHNQYMYLVVLEVLQS